MVAICDCDLGAIHVRDLWLRFVVAICGRDLGAIHVRDLRLRFIGAIYVRDFLLRLLLHFSPFFPYLSTKKLSL